MNIYVVTLVIFLTSLGLMFAAGWYLARPGQIPLDRLADPAPLPGEPEPACRLCAETDAGLICQADLGGQCNRSELPRAGYFDLPDVLAAVYGPFPVDTGPLLILSEQAAARADLEREIPRLCAEAEAKIPPRWR